MSLIFGIGGGSTPVTPGGSDTNVQYNDSGSFGGDSNFLWNKTTKLLTLVNAALASTTATSQLLSNTTAATNGSRVQVSPAIQWRGNGWRSNTSATQTIDFRSWVLPSTGTSYAIGEWKLQYSQNGAAYSDGLQYFTNIQDGVSVPKFKANALTQLSANNSSTIDTLSNLDLLNPTGTRINTTYTFGSTIKGGYQVQDSGYTALYAVGTSPTFNFFIGSSITSNNYVLQLYSGGVYCPYNGFFGGNVTAGQADTTPPATMTVYGSLALKGILITASTQTLAATETMVYVDPSGANECTGTPTACSTYTNSTDCGNHSGVGCTWFAGNACSAFNGTDQATCESGHSGCTYDTASCHTYDADQVTCQSTSGCTWNSTDCSAFAADQTTCETGHNGLCTWNYSDCHAFDGTDQTSCEINTGCTWTGGDCHAFDGTDQATCETGHTGCSWDGALCNGVYNEASICAGQYNTSCTGTFTECTGTYFTGVCSGTYGAACQGTAACINLVTSGSCAAESGCSWTSGNTVTLPLSSVANEGNVSRLYSIVHVGSSGTTTIQANTGDTILQYTNVKLYKKGDRVTFHHHNIIGQCSAFSATNQATCEANSGCTWTAAVVCSDYNGDEAGCNAQAGSGCSYSDPVCSGAGSASSCYGTYTSSKPWVIHNLERGRNYVEKTANYTLTDVDDIVNCTSGTFTITLPSAVTNSYKKYTIKNMGAGTITLNTTSSQTIDGLASGTITLIANDSIDVESNNGNWIIT